MSGRRRAVFSRRRNVTRQIINTRNTVILSVTVFLVFVVSSVTGKMLLDRKVKSSTVVYRASNIENVEENLQSDTIESNNLSDIKEVFNNEEKNSKGDNLNNDNNKQDLKNFDSNNENEKTEVKEDNGDITINLLGEISMVKEIGQKYKYIYMNAFKEICNLTKKSDFTYSCLGTNITNLEKLDDETKSEYIATKELISGLKTLGIDAVTVASDHMIDFGEQMINTTTGILETGDVFVAGLENMPLYFEKNGRKISIISTNSVIIGTKKTYSRNGISVYEKDNMVKNIKEAKQVADIVIVDVHWGKENTYGITEQMREIAKSAIDNGADMVIGSHALGVYPIATYKDKPIIYSLGSLINNSDNSMSKESYIFGISINAQNEIYQIEMTPVYRDDDYYLWLYKDYDEEKCNTYLNKYNKYQLENSLNSKIENSKIIVNLK